MSGLWAEPFDEYPDVSYMTQGFWSQVDSPAWAISTTKPRNGAKSLAFNPLSLGYARRIFGGPKSGAGFEYGLFLNSLPVREDPEFQLVLGGFLTAGALGQVMFVLGTDGAVAAYSNFAFPLTVIASTLLGRSLPKVVTGAYCQIGVKIGSVDPIAGTLEVQVNGETVLNLTGINTDPHSTGEVSQMFLYCTGTSVTNAFYIDDMHAWDVALGNGPSDFVGNAAVIYRAPNNDTATADWAAFGGTTPVYPLLGDNNDATGISAASGGQRSAFAFAALPGTAQGVIYQQIAWRGLKTDSGDCSVQPGFISGSAESDGSAQPMTTGETWRLWIEAYDPATSGAPWTPTSANASQGVLERTI